MTASQISLRTGTVFDKQKTVLHRNDKTNEKKKFNLPFDQKIVKVQTVFCDALWMV